MTVLVPILHVTTNHAEYVIDQNKGVYVRTGIHPKAADLEGFGIGPSYVTEYDEILSGLAVGERMHILQPDGIVVHSTPIVSIVEVPA